VAIPRSFVRLDGALRPRARLLARWLGFAAVGIATFIVALQLTFPFDRVKDQITGSLADKYDVAIGGVERSIIPGRMFFNAVTLRTRPARAGDVATTFYIDRLELNVGLFALLRGTAAVRFDARIGAGHITGTIALSRAATSIDVIGEDLPSARLPTREVLGLPMSGNVQFALVLELPGDTTPAGKPAASWARALGTATLACPSGCAVGDGKTKLKVTLKNQRSAAFTEGGIDFGKINIDTLLAGVEIKNGKLDVTRFELRSPDGELHVDFDMALSPQDINQSQITGCLRFNASAGLLKRDPKTHAEISTIGPLGPDNLFHVKLEGPLRDVRPIGRICGSAVAPAPVGAMTEQRATP
jgi:type II secretion system protein N